MHVYHSLLQFVRCTKYGVRRGTELILPSLLLHAGAALITTVENVFRKHTSLVSPDHHNRHVECHRSVTPLILAISQSKEERYRLSSKEWQEGSIFRFNNVRYKPNRSFALCLFFN